MFHDVREYAITYGVKTFLLSKSWNVIAYNPPGSQGTFTIPNPDKEIGYRGQKGSESPDVIACKENVVLIAECKPDFDLSDAEKLQRLQTNSKKMKILSTLIQRVCLANEVSISEDPAYIFALAYQGLPHSIADLGFLSVQIDQHFDIRRIRGQSSYEDQFATKMISASKWNSRIERLFEN